MPKTDSLLNADIVFVYTNIGRGHPSYLDGIVGELESHYPETRYYVTDVFSSGKFITRMAWTVIKWMYRLGSRGGMATRFYNRLRKGSVGNEPHWLLLAILGRDIRKMLHLYSGPVVVAHPILANILGDQNHVIYQHGELVFPVESVVGNCAVILVPTRETGDKAIRFGVDPAQLKITGQSLESDLISEYESTFSARIKRFQSKAIPTVAMFSSGAYPPEHLDLLYKIICSLSKCDMRLFIFMGQSIRELDRFGRRLSNFQFSSDLSGSENIHLISSSNRIEENQSVAKVFNQFDCFIAPSHERTNWAVGLGLPMLILTPHIGSYSPLNARFAIERGVAVEIHSEDAEEAGRLITDLRDKGDLAIMSQAGYQPSSVSGFRVAAEYLIQYHSRNR